MPRHVALYPPAPDLPTACEAAARQLMFDVIVINATVTLPFRGRPSLIAPNLLDSAVHRPFTMFGGGFLYQSGVEQAAALFQSLIQNHVFEDSNKRTAIMSCLFFLERCGYWQRVALLSDQESRLLEALTLARENSLVQNGMLTAPSTVAEIAEAVDAILGASRRR